MSVCSCPSGFVEYLGMRISSPHTARQDRRPKSGLGYYCPNCHGRVIPGQQCVDVAWIVDDYGGFERFHAECFSAMEMWAEEYCGGEWSYPFDLHEAAAEAVAIGWREWLELYEKTWPLDEGAADLETYTIEDCPYSVPVLVWSAAWGRPVVAIRRDEFTLQRKWGPRLTFQYSGQLGWRHLPSTLDPGNTPAQKVEWLARYKEERDARRRRRHYARKAAQP